METFEHKERDPGYFCIIPTLVLHDNNISDGSKILYGIISSLTSIKGYCWANNRYLCKVLNISIREVQRRLSELRDKGHLKIEVYVSDGDRKIWLMNPINKNPTPHDESVMPPHDESVMPPCRIGHTYNKIDNKETKTISILEKPAYQDNNSLIELPVFIDKELWESFIKHRKAIKKPMTQQAIVLMISKLYKLRDGGHNANEALRESIINGWSGVFEPKTNGKPQTGQKRYF